VDLAKGEGERFNFLGFVFRRVPAQSGKWWALRQPRPEKRTSLLAKLKAIFRAHVSRQIREVIDKINPILRGWVNYFALGTRVGASRTSGPGSSARSGAFWREPVEAKVSAGRSGVGAGSSKNLVSSTITT
jgi:hypothetical protein